MFHSLTPAVPLQSCEESIRFAKYPGQSSYHPLFKPNLSNVFFSGNLSKDGGFDQCSDDSLDDLDAITPTLITERRSPGETDYIRNGLMGPFDAQIKMEGANMGGHMFSDGMLAYMLPPGTMEDKLYLITMN